MKKKFKLKITYELLQALVAVIENVINENFGSKLNSWSNLASLLIIDEWINSRKIRDLLRFQFGGEIKISIKHELTASLAHIIQLLDPEPSTHLGNYLLQIHSDIHKYFI